MQLLFDFGTAILCSCNDMGYDRERSIADDLITYVQIIGKNYKYKFCACFFFLLKNVNIFQSNIYLSN